MKHFELWKLGLQNVLASALRSALTVLELSIGVAAILAVITLGEAGRTQVRMEIGKLGIDKVLVTAEAGYSLTAKDEAIIKSQLETQVDGLVCLPSSVSGTSASSSALLVGCSADYLMSAAPILSAGRLPTPGEWQTAAPCALVGEKLAEVLLLTPGKWFSAGGIHLQCVGLLKQLPVAAQIDFQSAVILPSSFLEPWTGGSIQQLSVHVPSGMTQDEAAQQTISLLAEYSRKPVNAVSMQLQAEAADEVVNIFMDVLKWVALICMLVGGVGVMNILLVSVRERRREIGIMQSLGATRPQICWLFLCEAILYAITGGIIGLMSGGALIAVAGTSIGLTPVVRFADCIGVFAAAMAVGLLSGVVPAARACMMRPIDALKAE